MALLAGTSGSQAPTGAQKSQQQTHQAVVPFIRAAQRHSEQGGTFNGIAINVSNPGIFAFSVPSYGFLRRILLRVDATGGTGVAATYYEDAPWSIISSVIVKDVNGMPIIALSGWEAFVAAKYGGYRAAGPDGVSDFSAGTTAGNFGFTLPLYLEFGRDALGCLPNMDASARYTVEVTLASGVASAAGPVYTAAPTGYPTVALSLEAEMYSRPIERDAYGQINSTTPHALGTVQYWSKQTASALSGAQTLQLTRVGNLIRNHIVIFRAASDGTRATAEGSGLLTSAFEMDWDSGVRYVGNLRSFRLAMYEAYRGQNSQNGVIILPNTTDPDTTAGVEYGDQWMPTVGASKLVLRFTPAVTVNATILTNDIVPASQAVHSAVVASLG